MTENVGGQRALWYALGGLGVGLAGLVWDFIWHGLQDDGEATGSAELFQAHWLMFLGVLIIDVSLFLAVRRVTGPRAAAIASRTAFGGALVMSAGFVWDSIRHAQGTESAGGHALIYAGLLVVVIGVPVALGSRTREGKRVA